MPPLVLTGAVLQAICPRTDPSTLAARLPALQLALDLAQATTPKRAAAMLAQLAFESGWFRQLVEEPSSYSGPYFEKYDPPHPVAAKLGNVHAGDGSRYRGRGFIELTGRDNYLRAGQAIGLDLEGHPELAEQPDVAAKVAAWYWTAHGLNALADAGDLEGITRRINGGLLGQSFRLAAYQRALAALGA